MVRGALLATEYGTNAVCLVLVVVCLSGAGAVILQRRKYLTLPVMIRTARTAPSQPPSPVAGGIYTRIRHPRYMEVLLLVLGFACVANYLILYVWAG